MSDKPKEEKREYTDEEKMLVIFGEEVDKRMLNEVMSFAAYVKHRGPIEEFKARKKREEAEKRQKLYENTFYKFS